MKNYRKLLPAILLIMSGSLCAQAQTKTEHKFSLDVGLQANRSANLNINEWGGGLYIEPKFSLSAQFKVGFRLQGDLFWGRGIFQSPKKYNLRGMGSYLLTTEYSFTNSSIRPFIGVGIGAFDQYHISAAEINRNITADIEGTGYGIVPRAGVQFNRFLVFADTHINVRSSLTNYLSIGMGYSFGFGKHAGK